MSNIYIVGVGMTPLGRHIDRSLDSLTGEALDAALKDAGCNKSDIETAFFSGTTQGHLQGQTFVPGQIVLSKNGLEGIPIFNIENACASGSSGFHLAVQMLRAGSCDVALAIGAEKMNIPDKQRMFSVFDGGWDITDPAKNLQDLLVPAQGFDVPEGHESERPYSVFMSVYAAFCRHHMKEFGTTQRQIAAVSAKNHQHSVHNELAQFRTPYSIDEVLQAPPITYPLTLPMCAPISDGAAAMIVCNEEGLKRIGADRKRAIKVLATVIRSATGRPAESRELHCERLAADQAYEIAGLGPKDMDVAEVHDATAMGEIIHAENLGLVGFGEAGPAAERGEFSIGGRIPINTSGGLESKGHPIGASGIGQIYELVTQLRGEAGKRQVDGARLAVHENSGGLNGIEEAVVAVNIFSNELGL
ncbi:thiolase family protein [uncultured Zhongshania sp.]|jgi:acetyl-CoA acetyltransferase|uniref:thiolase family protein n=1 Tax=uncultured Zhongshania sp. TaxID=1642288 RepID=UPI0030DA290C|tara:strand:- start:38771 stop:40021 length:1251 start_codon:yes stop_codon:yes gene_type:complete